MRRPRRSLASRLPSQAAATAARAPARAGGGTQVPRPEPEKQGVLRRSGMLSLGREAGGGDDGSSGLRGGCACVHPCVSVLLMAR